MYVYVIVNSEILKIYVGQHKGDDLGKYLSRKFWDANHRGSGKRSHLFAAMRKYVRTSWSIHPLISDVKRKSELDEWERFLIYALKAQHPDVGYNICDGGEGFTGPHTEEWKQRSSERLTGRPVSEETRAKIGASQPPKTPEQLAMLASYRPKSSPWLPRGRDAGFKHSDATLAKMRASAAGRIITPDAKKAMSAAKMGKPWPLARLMHTIAWG